MFKALVLGLALVGATGSVQAKEAEGPELQIWTACLSDKATTFSAMDIPAETAAKGSLGACKKEEVAYFDSKTETSFLENMTEGKWPAQARKKREAEQARQIILPDMENMVIAKVLELRAKPATSQ